MTHDPLETVLRLRKRAVDASRATLASSVAAATAADAAAREAEQAVRHETQLASEPSGDDRLVEAFATWLPGALHRAIQARAWHERQEAEVARCRAELTACRTALESIEHLVAERRTARDQEAARLVQRAMDEAGSRIARNEG